MLLCHLIPMSVTISLHHYFHLILRLHLDNCRLDAMFLECSDILHVACFKHSKCSCKHGWNQCVWNITMDLLCPGVYKHSRTSLKEECFFFSRIKPTYDGIPCAPHAALLTAENPSFSPSCLAQLLLTGLIWRTVFHQRYLSWCKPQQLDGRVLSTHPSRLLPSWFDRMGSPCTIGTRLKPGQWALSWIQTLSGYFPAVAEMLGKTGNMLLIVAKLTHLIAPVLMRPAKSVRAASCAKIHPCAFENKEFWADFDLSLTALVIIVCHIVMKCILRGKEKEGLNQECREDSSLALSVTINHNLSRAAD